MTKIHTPGEARPARRVPKGELHLHKKKAGWRVPGVKVGRAQIGRQRTLESQKKIEKKRRPQTYTGQKRKLRAMPCGVLGGRGYMENPKMSRFSETSLPLEGGFIRVDLQRFHVEIVSIKTQKIGAETQLTREKKKGGEL